MLIHPYDGARQAATAKSRFDQKEPTGDELAYLGIPKGPMIKQQQDATIS